MKKHLFTAVLAIIAISGAFAKNVELVNDYYSEQNNTSIPDITCDGGNTSCTVLFGVAYDKPATDESRELIPFETLLSQRFFN